MSWVSYAILERNAMVYHKENCYLVVAFKVVDLHCPMSFARASEQKMRNSRLGIFIGPLAFSRRFMDKSLLQRQMYCLVDLPTIIYTHTHDDFLWDNDDEEGKKKNKEIGPLQVSID